MYNGRPGSECSVAEGCLSGGIEPWFDGVSGRGVLIDGPTVTGRAFMEPSEALFPEDLDRFLAETGTTVEPGDLLFVRTGRDAYEAAGNPEATPVTSPGLDGTCLEWLADHQVSVIAGDGANDAMPATGVPSIGRVGPIHLVGLVHMGLWLIDNAERFGAARPGVPPPGSLQLLRDHRPAAAAPGHRFAGQSRPPSSEPRLLAASCCTVPEPRPPGHDRRSVDSERWSPIARGPVSTGG